MIIKEASCDNPRCDNVLRQPDMRTPMAALMRMKGWTQRGNQDYCPQCSGPTDSRDHKLRLG